MHFIEIVPLKYMKEQILNLIFPNYNKISSKYILVYPIQKRSEKVDTLSSSTTQQLDGGAWRNKKFFLPYWLMEASGKRSLELPTNVYGGSPSSTTSLVNDGIYVIGSVALHWHFHKSAIFESVNHNEACCIRYHINVF